MFWDGLHCVTGRNKSTDGGRSLFPPLTYGYATIFQISSPPTFQPCRASCSLEALGYSMTEVNIKTRIPPTASLKKTIASTGTEVSQQPPCSVSLAAITAFLKTLFLPSFSFDLCRSWTMYFITSDTYVKNVKPFKNTLFQPSAFWVLELSSCMYTHKEIRAVSPEMTMQSSAYVCVITSCLCIHTEQNIQLL